MNPVLLFITVPGSSRRYGRTQLRPVDDSGERYIQSGTSIDERTARMFLTWARRETTHPVENSNKIDSWFGLINEVVMLQPDISPSLINFFWEAVFFQPYDQPRKNHHTLPWPRMPCK